MNIPGFTTPTLFEFHTKVRECLAKDDANPNPQKIYGVRSQSDWRQLSSSIEAELTARGEPFEPIQW